MRWIYPTITYYWAVLLILDHSYIVGKLKQFENCWFKRVRILEVLKLLFQQFLNLSSSQRDMSGPILRNLSNNRWLRGIALSKLWPVSRLIGGCHRSTSGTWFTVMSVVSRSVKVTIVFFFFFLFTWKECKCCLKEKEYIWNPHQTWNIELKWKLRFAHSIMWFLFPNLVLIRRWSLQEWVV